MKFDVSERIRTRISQEELLTFLEGQFKKISENVRRNGQVIEAKAIEASFGSINRKDTTTVSLKKVEGGWVVIADVNYRPSIAFWIFLIIGLFGWVFWLIPIAFYLLQKQTVRTAIKECLERVKNEFEQSSGPEIDDIKELEKLGDLKMKGFITNDEFEAKKRQLFGVADRQSENPEIEGLEKLSRLKEKGFITDAEFAVKKKQLLGL